MITVASLNRISYRRTRSLLKPLLVTGHPRFPAVGLCEPVLSNSTRHHIHHQLPRTFSASRLAMTDFETVLKAKYPAKAHARRVVELLRDAVPEPGGVLYLEGRETKMQEDNDSPEPFRQRRHFYYLTGCNLADCRFAYDTTADHSILFIPPVDPDDVLWCGLPVSINEALARYDVDEVRYTTDVNATLASLAGRQKPAKGTAFAIAGHVSDSVTFLGFDATDLVALKAAIDGARVVKDAFEIAMMRKANHISGLAHAAVVRRARDAELERELEATFLERCVALGAREMAYHPILAAGRAAATLHYVDNDARLAGKLNLLIDAGAEWDNYASDIVRRPTRTFPLSGSFTKESRAIYDIVLKMQLECIGLIKAGALWDDIHLHAHKIAIDGLLSLGILKGDAREILEARTSAAFFPHGLGHYLGMDTHDVGGNPNRQDEDVLFRYLRLRGRMPAGSVIYFCEFILMPYLDDPVHGKYIDRAVLDAYWDVGGVRIEDNVLVTEGGCENLTTAVKDAVPSASTAHLSPDVRLRPSRSATQLRDMGPGCETPPALPQSVIVETEPARPHSSSGFSASRDTPRWKTALDEAQYWAGGLLGKPSESTRHYSIIRHSHALVWYRGPATSVSVTVLSDRPLPTGRKLWLQERGFSGNAGMAAKALVGSTRNWLDVTPVREARPEHLRDVEERGFQRDLRRFAQKATQGRTRTHAPRETLVVRIPAGVADGYFRLVLCDGKKVLCGSPVFRIASTSPDAAVVRGASLASLPLELGVRAASTVGKQMASKYMGVAGAAAQNRARALLRSSRRPVLNKAGSAMEKGCTRLGLVDIVREGWRRDELLSSLPATPMEFIGSGPEPPFPFKLNGKVVPGGDRCEAEPGFPTVRLGGVPLGVRARLRGVFAAWVRILPAKSGVPDLACHDWLEAVVTIAPPCDVTPDVAVADDVSIHVARDTDGIDFCSARLNVLLMGLLRPVVSLSTSEADLAGQHARDVATTLVSLARESWGADEADALTHGQRSVAERLVEATGALRIQVDRLPLHWAGVRSEAATLRDGCYGIGGLWIAR
ncbi:hypothetical protein L249_6704 [Ophiocordyceps polyrhachis-furcata BCC 54312]|uniref:Xaa-Pro aminopeptidase n=1 Tax=Ophiocordyceps polyrhachis-furcata BCC 54312 TaxID=1330021 RepID=A0A367LK90_9HYPO|nr:hypothetical protein L249_6704 [Ophiocordyceps polyrhachis-furcata BCC 54312]